MTRFDSIPLSVMIEHDHDSSNSTERNDTFEEEGEQLDGHVALDAPDNDTLQQSPTQIQEHAIDEDGHSDKDDREQDSGDDYDEEDDDVPDSMYIADMLRQLDVDWLQHPEYATHRLIVERDHTSTTTAAAAVMDHPRQQQDSHPGPAQFYHVMAQFLVPTSSIFCDFLSNQFGMSNDDDKRASAQEDENVRRLSCIEWIHDSEPSIIDFPDPPSAPSPAHPHPPKDILATLVPTTDSGIPTSRPMVRLRLPNPKHFPGLLQVMYDLDLDHWEATCFSPETIGPITQNIHRLECSSELTLRCLDYYRRIKGSEDEKETDCQSSMQELKELYHRAVENGLLPLNPTEE
ncbi:hypothetical protein BG011_009852 [Mortierella polycephala]|uniref:Uncharacterized protein n=1 Tax=Mortierella polycephala TaxID=41804 RepID=A0A9P6PNH7_9FUNG|nr:hypothetical protein BG011_009852 [Mortierella polycephala]